MKKSLIFCFALFVVIAACKKKDEVSMRTKLITSGKWKITQLYSVTNGMTNDLYSLYMPCQKDNLYIFNSDKSVSLDEGAIKCDTAKPQSYPAGTWEFQVADTKLKIQIDTIGVVSDIIIMNDTVMQLQSKAVNNGTTTLTTTRYRHTY